MSGVDVTLHRAIGTRWLIVESGLDIVRRRDDGLLRGALTKFVRDISSSGAGALLYFIDEPIEERARAKADCAKMWGVAARGFAGRSDLGGVRLKRILRLKTALASAGRRRKPRVMQKAMRDRYRLSGLENDELLAALSALVQREHELLSDFLAHLAELDERRLYLDLGFSSLFAFCTDALGLSRSSAGRRIAAARVCRRFPEAFGRAARGELELSVLCELSRYLNPENATKLFDSCSGKSYELVLELLAARFPKPDLRDSIRRLPVRAADFSPNIAHD